MGSFSTSLSGLDAEEQALSIISNDLSNLNTTAFKSATPVFSDLFYEMLGTDGAGDPVQVGVGATMSSVSSPMSQGSVTTTGVPTDVAIQGNGLFVLNQDGTQVYTRAGNFSLNSAGYLVDVNGNEVMGYPAVNGVVASSQSLAPIQISAGQTFPPKATTNVQLDMNLDATDTSLEPATGTFTVPAPTLPTSGQTVTVGGTTYTFATAISAQSPANQVMIGSDVASTLANLAGAIDASSANGQAAGTTYSGGTVANPLVSATSTANGLNLTAINTGTSGNALSTSTPWTAGSFGGADLSGGANVKSATGTLSVPPPLPAAGQTVTIGGVTYTFATAINNQSPADTVLIGADVASTLANLAGAINAASNGGQAAGTTYSTGTVANGSVTATGTTATALSLKAITGGTGGNSLATSSQWTAGTFGGQDLAGGVNAVPATATLTVGGGTLPNAGDTLAVGGTTYTFAAAINAQSPANAVLIGPDTTTTLANLMAAINATAADAGTGFSSSTQANGSVTATGSTATTLTLQAITGGTGANALAASTTWGGGAMATMNLSGGAVGTAATGTVTVPAATTLSAGDTITVAGTTYTFASAITGQSPANTVLIGPDNTATLANLMAAINATAADAGTDFSSSTQANGSVSATGSTATTVSLQATATGVGGNSLAVSTSWGNLAGGVNAIDSTGTLSVAIPLPTAGQTVTIGGTTYTFASSINGQSPADTVLIGSDVQSTLNNLAAAINATAADAGTAFSSATQANASATAAVPTASTLLLTAIQSGTAGNNSINSATNWSMGSFGTAQLAGGVDAAAATGSYTVPIALPTAGETVTIGDTTYTFASSITPQTAANNVLIGPDIQTTLANLAGAINAASTGGQAAGTTYSSGTIANTAVTATSSNATTIDLQAITSGSTGNIVPTATNWAAGSFGAGDLTGGTDAGTFSAPITVYDSLGNSHVLNFSFTKASAGNWTYQITIPAADVGATGNPQVVATGTLQFGPDGSLVSPPADVQGISLSGLADGAKNLALNWQLFSAPGQAVITQTAEPSATSGTIQNGYSAGTLQSYSINSSGVIDGVLSNDQTVALGQIALATFPNYNGLINLGNNDYRASLASGAASVAAPGTGGSGTLDGGSLEASNVDIATAFTMLIQAERGYQANAKAITTADDLMQSSINLIQS